MDGKSRTGFIWLSHLPLSVKTLDDIYIQRVLSQLSVKMKACKANTWTIWWQPPSSSHVAVQGRLLLPIVCAVPRQRRLPLSVFQILPFWQTYEAAVPDERGMLICLVDSGPGLLDIWSLCSGSLTCPCGSGRILNLRLHGRLKILCY